MPKFTHHIGQEATPAMSEAGFPFEGELNHRQAPKLKTSETMYEDNFN